MAAENRLKIVGDLDLQGQELTNGSNIIPGYTEGASYASSDQVVDGDKLWIANKAIISAPATLNTTDWDEAGSGGGLDNTVVRTTGAQEISGVKTFNETIVGNIDSADTVVSTESGDNVNFEILFADAGTSGSPHAIRYNTGFQFDPANARLLIGNGTAGDIQVSGDGGTTTITDEGIQITAFTGTGIRNLGVDANGNLTDQNVPGGGGVAQADFNALDHRVTLNEQELSDAVQPNEITTTTTTVTTVRNGVNTFGTSFTGYTGTFGNGTLSIQRSTAFPDAVNALVRGNILANANDLSDDDTAELSFTGRTERTGTHHVSFTAHNAAATTLINANLTSGFIFTLTNAQVMNVLENMQLLIEMGSTSTTVMPGPETGVVSSSDGLLQRRDLALASTTPTATSADIATRGYVDSRATSSGNYDSTNTASPRGITVVGGTGDTFLASDVGSQVTFGNIGTGLDWVAGDTGFGHSGDFDVNVAATGTGFNFTVVSYNTTTGELVVTAREIFKTTGRSHANWDVTKQILPVAYSGGNDLSDNLEYRNEDLVLQVESTYTPQALQEAFSTVGAPITAGAIIRTGATVNTTIGADNTNPTFVPGAAYRFDLIDTTATPVNLNDDIYFIAELTGAPPVAITAGGAGFRVLFNIVSLSPTLTTLATTTELGLDGGWRMRLTSALESLRASRGININPINPSWIDNTPLNIGDAQTSENFNVSYTLPQLAAIGLTFDPLTLEDDTLPFDENSTLTNAFVVPQDTNEVAIGTDTADVLDAYLTSTLSAAVQTAISNGLADTNPTNDGALIEFTVGGEIAGLFFQRDPEDLVWRMNNGFAPAPNGINVPAGTAFRLRYFDEPIPVFNNAGRVPFEGSEADLDSILLGYNGVTTPVDGVRYLPLVNNAQLTSAYVDTDGVVTTTVESMTKRRDAFGPFLDLELNESYRDLNGNRSDIYEPLTDTNARSISLQLVSKVLNSDLYTEGNAAGTINIDGKEVRVPGTLDGSERFEADQAGDVSFVQHNPLTGFNDGFRITYTDNTTNSGTKSSIVEIPGIQSNRDRIQALEGGGDAHSHTSDAFGSFPYPGSVSGTFAGGDLVGNADGFSFNTVNPVWSSLTTVTDAAQAHINAGRTFSTGTASQTLATPLGLNFIIGAATKVQGGSFPWLGTSLRPGEFNLRAGQNLITGDTSDPARELFLALENSFLWGYTDETATYRNSLSFAASNNVNAGAPGLRFGVTPTQRNPLTQFIGNGEYRQDVVVSFVGFNGVEEEFNLGLTRVVHYTGPILAQDNTTTVNIPDTGAGASTRGEYLSHQAAASHYVITNGTVPKGINLGRLDAQMFWLYPIIQDPATRSSSQFTRRVVNYSGGAQTVGIENRYGNPNNPDIGNELRFYLPDDELNEIYGQDGRLTQIFQFPGIDRSDIQSGLGAGVNGFARDITLDFASIDPTDSTAVLLPTIGQDDFQVSDGGSSLRSRLTGSAITITNIGPSDPLDNLFGRQFRVQVQTFDTAIPNFQFVTRYNNAAQRSGWIGINQNNPDSVLSVAYTPRFFVDGSANAMGETRVSNLLRRDDNAVTFIFDGATGDLLPVDQYPTEAEYSLSQVTVGRIDYGSGRENTYIDLRLPTVGAIDYVDGTNIGPQLGTSSVITELWQANLGSNVNLHTLGGPRDTTTYPLSVQASWFYNQRVQQPDGEGGMEDSLVLTTPVDQNVLQYGENGVLEFSDPLSEDKGTSISGRGIDPSWLTQTGVNNPADGSMLISNFANDVVRWQPAGVHEFVSGSENITYAAGRMVNFPIADGGTTDNLYRITTDVTVAANANRAALETAINNNAELIPLGGGGSGRGFSVEGTAVGGTGVIDFNDDQTPATDHRAVTFSSGADNTIQAEVNVSGLGGSLTDIQGIPTIDGQGNTVAANQIIKWDDANDRWAFTPDDTGSGAVPTPQNPGDDTRILTASGGAFTWQDSIINLRQDGGVGNTGNRIVWEGTSAEFDMIDVSTAVDGYYHITDDTVEGSTSGGGTFILTQAGIETAITDDDAFRTAIGVTDGGGQTTVFTAPTISVLNRRAAGTSNNAETVAGNPNSITITFANGISSADIPAGTELEDNGGNLVTINSLTFDLGTAGVYSATIDANFGAGEQLFFRGGATLDGIPANILDLYAIGGARDDQNIVVEYPDTVDGLAQYNDIAAVLDTSQVAFSHAGQGGSVVAPYTVWCGPGTSDNATRRLTFSVLQVSQSLIDSTETNVPTNWDVGFGPAPGSSNAHIDSQADARIEAVVSEFGVVEVNMPFIVADIVADGTDNYQITAVRNHTLHADGTFELVAHGVILDMINITGGGEFTGTFDVTSASINSFALQSPPVTEITDITLRQAGSSVGAPVRERQSGGGASNLLFDDGFGIQFADGGGNASSNTLSEYEEGTWTPSIISGQGFLNAQGQYVRVGDMVTIEARMVFPTSQTDNDETVGFRYSGVPFSPRSIIGPNTSAATGAIRGIPSTGIPTVSNIQLYIGTNANFGFGINEDSDLTPQQLNGAEIYISATYRVA